MDLKKVVSTIMKRILWTLGLALTLGLSLPLTDMSSAAKATATSGSPVLLKINQYYVVYTSPQSPYLDASNRLMVPLRSLSDLVAAEVSYDAGSRSAVISRKNSSIESETSYTLKMTIGQKDIELNGAASQMDTIPVLIQGSMYIPLSVVTKALHLDTKWDPVHKIISLTEDPGYLPSGVVFDEEHVLGQHTDPAVRPVQSVIRTVVNESGIKLAQMQLTALNTGASAVGANQYLRFYVQDSNFSHFDLSASGQTQPGATFSVENTKTILAQSLRYILVEPSVD
jgi:hypothetical protein